MPYVKTLRGQFFYQESGSTGPIVYLLHGLTAKCQDWETVPSDLSRAGFHVYAFDMRGHGMSDKPESGYSPEDLARDVDASALVLNHEKIHLVGHSAGGRTALYFATMFPAKVLTLTIIDQTLTADPDGWKKSQETYAEYPAPFSSGEDLDEFLLERFPDSERRRHYEKGQFHRREDGLWNWNFSILAALEIQRLGRAKEIHWLLKRVKCPILFLKGGKSELVTLEEAQKIRETMPSGQLVTIEEAGHGLFRDEPQAFHDALVPFLKAVPS
jgi:pimeloyl-ACP methyl ester carboxylesterase